MLTKNVSRREFIKQNSLTGLSAVLTPSVLTSSLNSPAIPSTNTPVPTLLRRRENRPYWVGTYSDERLAQLAHLESGNRRKTTAGRNAQRYLVTVAIVTTEFEPKWAQALGVKRSLLVVNGTNALITALTQLDIRAGDEVLVPPYTFIATVAAVLATGAMPVFVDVDPETFQIDPAKIEAKITPRTKAITAGAYSGLTGQHEADSGHCQKA